MSKKNNKQKQVIYRAYRPSDFTELIGQDIIVRILQNSVRTGQLSHSYLFVGSRGTGKTSTARIMAKAINCLELKKDGNPCGECENCKSIETGTFLDLVEIDAASNRGIDQVRELKERIEFSPVMGKYKVYIIDEVHMMTTEAFNALLKTLEEPPAHVIFILATTEPHKLPATILSRCQRHDFKLGTEKDIQERVTSVLQDTDYTLTEGALRVLIKNAAGSYRDVLSLLEAVLKSVPDADGAKVEIDQDMLLGALGIPMHSVVESFLQKLLFAKEDAELFEFLYEIERDGVNFPQFIKSCLELLREAFVYSNIGGKVKESSEFVRQVAKSVTKHDLIAIISIFLEADAELKRSPISVLVMELLVFRVREILAEEIREEKPQRVEKKEKRSVIKKVDCLVRDSSSKVVTKVKSRKKSSPHEDSAAVIKKERVEESWKQLKKNIKKENAHLGAILEGAKVSGIVDGELEIEVGYAFAKDLLEAPKTRQIVTDCMLEICGSKIKYSCKVVQSTVKKMPKDPLEMGIVFSKEENEKGDTNKEDSVAIEATSVKRATLTGKKVDELFAGM